MLGTVLSYSPRTGAGIISGADSQRYTFRRSDWRSDAEPVNGWRVDFLGDDGTAAHIYALVTPSADKNKLVASLLALFMGAFGVHKFYLGHNFAGFIMLLVFLSGIALMGIPSIIIAAIAFIEGVMYLVKSDTEFEATYIRGRRAWF